jgi:hypothetical protein
VQRTFNYRGITYSVVPGPDEQTFLLRLLIDGETIEATTRTRLLGMAKRRAQTLINRKLREKRKKK